MRSKPSILWRNLKILWKSGKIRKKNPETGWISGKENHIWEVNHPFCEEIWLKLLKSKDLRSAPLKKKRLKKKKEIFKLLSFVHEVKILYKILCLQSNHNYFVLSKNLADSTCSNIFSLYLSEYAITESINKGSQFALLLFKTNVMSYKQMCVLQADEMHF